MNNYFRKKNFEIYFRKSDVTELKAETEICFSLKKKFNNYKI